MDDQCLTARLSVGSVSADINGEEKTMLEEAYAHSQSLHVPNSKLTNYYKKTETYSKSEVDTKVVNEISPLADDIENSKTTYTGYKCSTLANKLNTDYYDFQQRLNNATYLEYEGCNISANETYFGYQKDTVVKGRTLQNLWNGKFRIETQYNRLGANTTTMLLKDNTVYSIVNRTPKTIIMHNYILDGVGLVQGSNVPIDLSPMSITLITTRNASEYGGIGRQIFMLGTTWNSWELTEPELAIIEKGILFLEGDYTNTPIEELPFIEGIQSVGDVSENYAGYKIKGKSCGKNLFDGQLENGTYDNSGALWASSVSIRTVNPIPVKPSTNYTLSFVNNTSDTRWGIYEYDENLKFIVATMELESLTIKTSPTTKYIKFRVINVSKNIQLEQGTTPTTYEEYQETPYEYYLEGPLMSLPNGVRDELNMSKGVVRRRVGKYTFKGTETFGTASEVTGDDIICVYATHSNCMGIVINKQNNIICDNLPTYNYGSHENIECIMSSMSAFIISLNKSKLVSPDIEGVKQWLKDNPTTIYYQLPEPYEEQVDIKYLKSFDKQTHIMSDNKIIPYVKTKIPSNVQAVVSNLIEENNELINSNTEIKASAERIVEENNKQQTLIEDLNVLTEFLISESLL